MRRALVLSVFIAAFAAAPSVAHAEEVSLLMDDGARIDASLLTPAGAPPAGGWPALMMFHGLGGSHAQLLPLAGSFREQGYAVFGGALLIALTNALVLWLLVGRDSSREFFGLGARATR
ncbi:MAG TPA: hypothetical protein VF101_15460 [Gaiellaceae bacterium]